MNPIHAAPSVSVRTSTYQFPTKLDAFSFFVAFVREFGEEQGFLLDSVVDAKSQYVSSMIGLFPVLEVRGKGERLTVTGESGLLQGMGIDREQKIAGDLPERLDRIFEGLSPQSGLPPYALGFLGFFGYDAVRYFETLPQRTVDDRNIDDFRLQIHRVVVHVSPEKTTVFVHEFPGVEGPGIEAVERALSACADGDPRFEGYDRTALQVMEDVSYADYVRRIERTKEYIRAGDVFQCVVSKRMRVVGTVDTLEVYGRLRKMNPSPYMFYINYGEYLVFGASPEMQVRLEGGLAQMKPIAGTTKGKGRTAAENERLVADLLSDPKEGAEHVMLVDLCRNDLGRIAEPGTVEVRQLLGVEEYSHVFHLVSHVTATVKKGVGPFEAFLATFPAGTLSGAPKVRAMEIIEELEDFRRGPYGGVIGMFDCQGNMDTAIVIRTVVYQDRVSYLQAGAGIVADSDPAQEWLECNHKLGALRATIC